MPCVGELPVPAMCAVLAAMDERVVVLRREDPADPESLRYIWANYEWDPDNELSTAQLLGRRVVDVFPGVSDSGVLGAYIQALESQEPIGLPEIRTGDERLPDRVYSIQAVPLGPDLVASVVRNLTGVRRAQAALQILNRDLELRIVEATADVRAANQELESFAYSVSHDLRAPLRALTGFSEYLVETQAEHLDAEGRYLLGRIQAGALRMGELIDALLELSRLTRQSLERQPVDVVAVSRDLLAGLQEAEPDRKLEFQAPKTLLVDADPALTRALLANLLGNSWKFCRGRRVTRITLIGLPGDLVQVQDNGVGFDPAYAEQLFRPFGRLHEGDSYEGMGIGLAIVDRIVKRHGGRISAEGRPGKGAVFTLSLEARNP